MFEQATLSGGPLSTRVWSTCAGVGGQAFVVGALLVFPLIWPAALPQIRNYVALTPPGPPPPPPGPLATVRPKGTIRPQPATAPRGIYIPRVIPPSPAQIVDDPPELGPDVGPGVGVPGGTGPGVPGGLASAVLQSTHLLPPPSPPPVAPPKRAALETPPAPPRHRQGGLVKLAAPIHRVEPVYPPIAISSRVEGVVELEGVVGIDGRIHDLKVKGGHPFLVKAAVDAVRQWVYSPGTLNGELVEVIAPITVTFRLGR
jgi:protein TonB